ncbi:MAG: hypothetical protein P8074_27690, partial [Anaerolineales bacterium]
KVTVGGQPVTLVALPLIFQQFHSAGKAPGEATAREMLAMVKIYNPIPAEDDAYREVLLREYTTYCEHQGVTA